MTPSQIADIQWMRKRHYLLLRVIRILKYGSGGCAGLEPASLLILPTCLCMQMGDCPLYRNQYSCSYEISSPLYQGSHRNARKMLGGALVRVWQGIGDITIK